MAESSIRIICPNLKCRKILAVPQAARGRVVVCSNCGTSVKVPDQRIAKPAVTTPPDDRTR